MCITGNTKEIAKKCLTLLYSQADTVHYMRVNCPYPKKKTLNKTPIFMMGRKLHHGSMCLGLNFHKNRGTGQHHP